MTVREWVIAYCFERGMFADQARAVADALAADPAGASMAGRWGDDVRCYPAPLLTVLALQVDRQAVAWIEANLPHAWFKGLFYDPGGSGGGG